MNLFSLKIRARAVALGAVVPLLLAQAACSSSAGMAAPMAPSARSMSAAGDEASASAAAPVAQTAPAAPGNGGPAAPLAAKVGPSNAAHEAVGTEMIVYTGGLVMLVPEAKLSAALDGAVDVAESVGGHLASRSNTTVTMKVPSGHFREAMTKMEGLGEVTDRKVAAEDVTEQFHDAEVRLQNLRATRQRLQEFLARAGNIADTLTVERELERVAQEIDVLEGRLHFLKDRATWSQIQIDVHPAPLRSDPVVPTTTHAEPSPRRVLDLPVPWLSELGVQRLLNLH